MAAVAVSHDKIFHAPPHKTDWLEWLEIDLMGLEDCQVECNGMSWAISYLLGRAGVEHECMLGYVMSDHTNEAVTPHYWITLPGGWIIDLRLRLWLGDTDDVPHGVFHVSDATWFGMRYEGAALPKVGLEFTREFVMDMTSDLVAHVNLSPPPSEFKEEKAEDLT